MKRSDHRFAQIAIIIKDYSTLQIKDYRMLKFNSVDRENVRSQVCTDCNYNQRLQYTLKSRIIECLNLIVLTVKMSDHRFAQIANIIKEMTDDEVMSMKSPLQY